MKIRPFDIYADAGGGQLITLPDLKAGLEPFRKIRAAVGDKIEVMAELHSLWNTTSAIPICHALEDYGGLWAEDPILKMDDVHGLTDLRRQSRTPIRGSETLAGTVPFRDLLAADAVDFVMLDLAWCGGLTEGRKIAALADAYAKPLAPHDCTGPVTLWASRDHPGGRAGHLGDLVTDLPSSRTAWCRRPRALVSAHRCIRM